MKTHAFALPIAVILLASTLAASAAVAGSLDSLRLNAPVSEIRQSGSDVFVRAGGWKRLSLCASAPVCVASAAPPRRVGAPDGIPHGYVVTSAGGGTTRAWYTEPTTRYGHGVLGDAVEAGGLAVIAGGTRVDLRLSERFVFEDIAPRLADLDGDGVDEVVTIRSDVTAGAALAVYRLQGGSLVEIASIAPIGIPNRWLNVAGIADYTGDGRLDIAIVKTPHIGGRLEVWTLRGDRLIRAANANGFSNHFIGSSELGLSATADISGDGVADLVLPDARRGALRFMSFVGGAREVDAVQLPLRVNTALGVLEGPTGPVFVVGLSDGTLAVVASE